LFWIADLLFDGSFIITAADDFMEERVLHGVVAKKRNVIGG
jgi:hypothetical protein